MGKTFRRNEGRFPKWDKRGKKSHKLREYDNKPNRHHKLDPIEPEVDLDLDLDFDIDVPIQ